MRKVNHLDMTTYDAAIWKWLRDRWDTVEPHFSSVLQDRRDANVMWVGVAFKARMGCSLAAIREKMSLEFSHCRDLSVPDALNALERHLRQH